VRWEPALQVYPVRERLKRLIEERRAAPAARPRFVLTAQPPNRSTA